MNLMGSIWNKHKVSNLGERSRLDRVSEVLLFLAITVHNKQQ